MFLHQGNVCVYVCVSVTVVCIVYRVRASHANIHVSLSLLYARVQERMEQLETQLTISENRVAKLEVIFGVPCVSANAYIMKGFAS